MDNALSAAPVDRLVGRHDLFVCIDREHQTIDFQVGNQPFVGQWIEGMPGDGAIYRDEDGKVIGGFFPLPFLNVKLHDPDLFPVFDSLPRLWESGHVTKEQDGKWWLFRGDGEGLISGETFRDLCINIVLGGF